MRIRTGKNYLNANGHSVSIVSHDPRHVMPFVDSEGTRYTDTGRASLTDLPSLRQYNLTSEAIDAPDA